MIAPLTQLGVLYARREQWVFDQSIAVNWGLADRTQLVLALGESLHGHIDFAEQRLNIYN